jgi:hypothetical protein
MLLSLDPLRLLELASTMLLARPSSTWLLASTHLVARLAVLPPASRDALSASIASAYPLCTKASVELLSTSEGMGSLSLSLFISLQGLLWLKQAMQL